MQCKLNLAKTHENLKIPGKAKPPRRTEAETKASAAKEPCVLAEYPDGSLGMFLDRQELRVVDGNVDRFAKLVRARLALFF